MHTIREFNYTDSDYQALADLFAAVSGNCHQRPEDIQHMDKIRGPEIPFARFVAIEDGQMIAEAAHGQSIWFGSSNKLNLNIEVHPDVKGNVLRTEMYAHLVRNASRHHPTAFSVRVIEDEHAEIRFWKDRGFQQVSREPRAALDLASFDPTPFIDATWNLENQGIKIHSLADLKSNDPDWLHKWWQMEWLILQDLASEEEPAIRRTLEQFEGDVQHPAIIPEAFFFALEGDDYVAITGLTFYDEITYMADLTWAIPSHQGLGIELALKLKAIQWAQDTGAVYLIDEAVENDPGHLISLKLGYEHLPAWLIFEKQIR